MNVRLNLWFVCLVGVFAAACGSSPSQPSGTSSPGGLTASVTAPQPVSPTAGAQVRYADQPVSLTVQNATTTKGAVTYTFEVATDSAFSAKVQLKDNVPEGPNGQTTVKLDALPGNRDYYWHARATSAGTTGLFGTTFKFTLGAAVVIDPPTLILPANGATTVGWPIFRIGNSARSGTAGFVVYKFEVSNSAAFTTILLSQTVSETAGQTSFAPPVSQPAPPQNTLYWRVTAIDTTNNVSSAPSVVQSFVYSPPTPQALLAQQAGYILWPGVQPPGTPGHAQLGANWDVATVVSFDGVRHTKPTLEELQAYDLIDRGMDPGSALAWMNANGYGTTGVWYPDVQVIGFPFEYIALVNGAWQLVIRVGG
jgi:hypothetical protein